MAGAYALVQSRDAIAAADRDLALNNQVPLLTGRQVQPPPTSGPFTGDTRAVRVVITSRQTLPFWSFFTNQSPTLTAEATARIVPGRPFCVFTTEDGNNTGIDIGGSADLNLGCGMATNSTSTEAITAGGSSSIIATPLSAPGDIPASSNFKTPTEYNPYSPKIIDPYETLAHPTVPSNCQGKLSQGPNDAAPTITAVTTSATDTGGTRNVYCFAGMDLKGTWTMPNGTYIINGDVLDFGSQANLTCASCTFILTSSTAATNPGSVASLDMNAGAKVNFTAPVEGSGTYAGILIYQDRRATLLNEIKINGHSTGKLQGAIYMPRAQVRMNGSAGWDTKCLQLITRRLDFKGNGDIDNDCPANSGVRDLTASSVRLVG
jgi:hypothetical protein